MEKRHQLKHNVSHKCYEFDLGGDTALIEYTDGDGFVVLTHTEVPEKYEGQGIASELTRAVLEDLRSKGKKIVPQCEFTASYIKRHPEWSKLLHSTESAE